MPHDTVGMNVVISSQLPKKGEVMYLEEDIKSVDDELVSGHTFVALIEIITDKKTTIRSLQYWTDVNSKTTTDSVSQPEPHRQSSRQSQQPLQQSSSQTAELLQPSQTQRNDTKKNPTFGYACCICVGGAHVDCQLLRVLWKNTTETPLQVLQSQELAKVVLEIKKSATVKPYFFSKPLGTIVGLEGNDFVFVGKVLQSIEK
ncbi:hypothetical protein RFI_24945 [Reticulomyxa filosa]|uniref:Uncharacterized protein n=1 Tax=Reticulomyxa filosa TaxID=46433 RepID=X6MFL3_RETFI|nr:hypothetical protein RFI_24945 [Reticulomyxa filosa]|eukprot:ETO12431.1 hypothetical protein RFI_24945 [Reticulomyxa filosa]